MRTLLAFVLLAVAVGCSSEGVDTGAGTNPTADPTGTGTGTPNPTGTATPTGPCCDVNTTTPVNSVGGFFFVTRVVKNDGTDDVQIAGFFNAEPFQSTSPAWDAFFSYFASTAADTCITITASSQGGALAGLDAGDPIMLSSAPLQKLALGPMIMYSGYQPASFWQPHGTWTLTAPGGPNVAAFSAEIQAPGHATMLSPNPATVGHPMPVSTGAGLDLTWTPDPQGGFLLVFLSQGALLEPNLGYEVEPEKIRMCRVTDDGAFTVPASILDDFKPENPPTEDDVIQVQRYRWHTILPAGASGPVLVQTDSSTYYDVIWQ